MLNYVYVRSVIRVCYTDEVSMPLERNSLVDAESIDANAHQMTRIYNFMIKA